MSGTPEWEPRLRALVERMAAGGVATTVVAPGVAPIAAGRDPERTRVELRDEAAVAALLRGDHLALAEAFLEGRVEVTGDLGAVLAVTDHLDLGPPSRLATFAWRARSFLDWRRFARRSIAFHYDRPPSFFLAWLDPSRSYTHGLYETPDDALAVAQERKLAAALDALAVAPGQEVLDVGCGWGSFLEYAGRRGVRVHGLTLSREQHRFVSDRIRALDLPCSVECVDFLAWRPDRRFDGAVFMGSLEHIPDHRRVARFLERHLAPEARVWADFVSSREGPIANAFLRKYVFPGVSGYVDLEGLVGSLLRAGFALREISDDRLSCAWTVRDWARALEASHAALAAEHGEATVRAFLLYLWSSHRFLMTDRTQAYHLVAARDPDAAGRLRSVTAAQVAAAIASARQSAPKRSPARA